MSRVTAAESTLNVALDGDEDVQTPERLAAYLRAARDGFLQHEGDAAEPGARCAYRTLADACDAAADALATAGIVARVHTLADLPVRGGGRALRAQLRAAVRGLGRAQKPTE